MPPVLYTFIMQFRPLPNQGAWGMIEIREKHPNIETANYHAEQHVIRMNNQFEVTKSGVKKPVGVQWECANVFRDKESK